MAANCPAARAPGCGMLTPALSREDRGILGEPYFVRDGHWNAVGHRVAAESVRAYLEDARWLPDCAQARSVSR